MIDEKSTKQSILSAYQKLAKQAKTRRAAVPPELLGFSAKNTKGDLLAALRALDAALKKQADSQPEQGGAAEHVAGQPAMEDGKESRAPEREPEAPLAAPRKEDAQKASEPVREEDDLKLLNQDILDKLQALEQAKTLKRREYEGYLAIERKLEQMIAELNRNRDMSLEREKQREEARQKQVEENERRLEQCRHDAEETAASAEQKLEQARREIEESVRRRDSERAAEQERYSYELSVSCRKEDDAWQDESEKRENNLTALLAETEALETTLAERETLLPELNAALSALPEQMEAARAEGKRERAQELEEELAHQSALAKKEADALAYSLERQIQGLREDYEALMKEKADVQAKLDRAYDEGNKLYLQTVQSAGGVKILNGSDKT